MRMMTRPALIAVLLAGVLVAPVIYAQTPAPKPAPPAAAPAQATPEQPPTQSAYAYQVEGRRDPFVSLLGRGADPTTGGVRPPGLSGLLIAEVSVKGIIKDQKGFFAMLQGPDNKTYPVRPGDKLLDGSVRSVNGEAVIFSQDVNDPLSVVKQREVTKRMRSTEEGRE